MSHSLYVGQRVILKLDEIAAEKNLQFTITGFSKYNQFDMNGNELVNILYVDKDMHFTSLSVHFSLLEDIDSL